MTKTFELGIKLEGLGKKLSNFWPYNFTIDGVPCTSIETWLQSMKFQDPEMQTMMCASEKSWQAYKAGNALGNDWKDTQYLWWQQVPYKRGSMDYLKLLERGYEECFRQNPDFRQALIDSEFDLLTHHIIGKNDQIDTVLTVSEYLYNMYRLRSIAFQELI